MLQTITLPVSLFIFFPEAILVTYLGLLLLGIRPVFKKILQIGLLQIFFLPIIRFLPSVFGLHTLVQILILSLGIYLVMGISYKAAFITASIGIMLYAFLEAIMILLFLVLSRQPFTAVINNFWLRLICFLGKGIFTSVIIYLIRRFNLRLTRYTPESVDNNPCFFKIFPIAGLFLFQNTMVILFFLANFVEYSKHPVGRNLRAYYSSLLFIIPALILGTFFLGKKIIALIHSEIETKIQLNTLSHVEELLHTIRAQRHNFNHELQVVYGLLEVKAFHEATDYIKTNMREIAVTSELVKTDHLGIMALLYTKTGLAEAKKIHLHIDVKTSLRNLPMDSRDINIILGNLIDNALEAVVDLPPSHKKVEVILSQELEGYVFEIINYGRPIERKLTEKIFEPGFSTKGDGRGMGLYSVRQLVYKHKGTIQINSDLEFTCFKICIPMN